MRMSMYRRDGEGNTLIETYDVDAGVATPVGLLFVRCNHDSGDEDRSVKDEPGDYACAVFEALRGCELPHTVAAEEAWKNLVYDDREDRYLQTKSWRRQ